MNTAKEADQFNSIWEDAKRNYAEITKHDLQDPRTPRPTSLEELEQLLEQQNRDFQSFREKKHLIFGTLKNICVPIQTLGGVIAQDASNFFPPTGLCFASVAYFIQAANGVSEAYDAIRELLEDLATFLVRMRVYSRETISDELRSKIGQILALLLEVFARSTKMLDGGISTRFRHFAKNFFVGKNDKIQNLLSKINKMTEDEVRLVGAEVSVDVKSQSRKIDGLAIVSGETNTMVQQISVGQEDFRKEFRKDIAQLTQSSVQTKKDQGSKHLKAAKDLLNPSSTYSDRYRSISNSRIPNTGDWIRSEPLFRSWIQRSIPIVYVAGIPGAGKSYLSGNIISYLRENHPQEVFHPSRTSVAYFFFKDNAEQTRNFPRALKDMAYQISLNDSVYAAYLESRHLKETDIDTLTSVWEKLFLYWFVENVNNDSKVFIVIDGLDESFPSDRAAFLSLLKGIYEATSNPDGNGGRIQILLVGRPEIEEEISDAIETEVPTIYVGERKNSNDVISYIHTSLRRSKNLSSLKNALQEEVVNTLAKNARGMFMWVDLMMRELSKKSRPNSVREALKNVPKGLNDALKHVLEGFSASLEEEQDVVDLNTMLAWVTCAFRPLSLLELDNILKLHTEDENGVINLEGKLRKAFASFFNLVRLDGLSTANLQNQTSAEIEANTSESDEQLDEEIEPEFWDVENETRFDSNRDTTTVELCHASIGDFLRDPTQGKVVATGEGCLPVGVDIVRARALTLDTCLRLLTDPNFASNLKEVACLRRYAERAWSDHLNELTPYLNDVDQESRKSITSKLICVLFNEKVVKNWVIRTHHTFFTMKRLESFKAWFSYPDVVSWLNPAEQDFVKGAILDLTQFYKPAATVAIRSWLQSEHVEYFEYDILNVCLTLVAMLKSGKEVTVKIPASLEDVHAAADWSDLERNALWHRGMGLMLMESKFLQEAIEEYNQALELEPGMYFCHHELLYAYENQNKFAEVIAVGEKEIDRMLADKEKMPNYAYDWNLAIFYRQVAKAYISLQDFDKSVEFYRKGFQICPSDFSTVKELISVLHLSKRDHQGVIDILKQMSETIADDDESQFYQCVKKFKWRDGQFFQPCASSAQQSGELEWLQDAYRRAVKMARHKKEYLTSVALEICLAQLYGEYGTSDDKAAVIWGRLIRKANATSGKANLERLLYKRPAEKGYMRYNCYRALNYGPASPRAEKHIKNLEKLYQINVANIDYGSTITSHELRIWLGNWYRMQGNATRANSYFQPHIKEALMLLIDDNLSNHNHAFYRLSHTLIAAGDEKSAISMLQVITPRKREIYEVKQEVEDDNDNNNETAPENTNQENVAVSSDTVREDAQAKRGIDKDEEKASDTWVKLEAETREEEEFPTAKEAHEVETDAKVENSTESEDGIAEERTTEELEMEAHIKAMNAKYDTKVYFHPWECDGQCHKSFPTWHYASICRLCLRAFCQPCLKLLKKGKQENRLICSPHHDWLTIPRPEVDNVPPGAIFIDGKVVQLKDYVAKLRREWDV